MLYICTRIRRRGTSFEGTTTLSRKLDPSPTSKSRYLAAFIFADGLNYKKTETNFALFKKGFIFAVRNKPRFRMR